MPNIGEHAENLPDDKKSHPYGVRLHPSVPDEKVAIDYIRSQQQQGKKMRSIFVDLVLYRLGLETGEDVKIPVMDAKQITNALRDILNRLKKGLVMQGTPASLAAAESLDVSDDDLQQFGRFHDLGMDASEDDDDGPVYYDLED